jgi:hypothetical protein
MGIAFVACAKPPEESESDGSEHDINAVSNEGESEESHKSEEDEESNRLNNIAKK